MGGSHLLWNLEAIKLPGPCRLIKYLSSIIDIHFRQGGPLFTRIIKFAAGGNHPCRGLCNWMEVAT